MKTPIAKYALLLVMPMWLSLTGSAQELQARVMVAANQVGSKVDKKIFTSLQNALNIFLNQRKWTKETYQQNEKINCSFVINVISAGENNVFNASLTVQAARPVYNSSYQSPLINFMDENLVFRYVEFQPLDFNENRVNGNDPLTSNLTAVFAYYVYLILGLDGDSFALKGGESYFQRVQNIVNNAPDSRELAGWKAFDGQRNRYWLMENLTNARYTLIHDAMYGYFRQGLDQFYEKETTARKSVLNALQQLNTLNSEIPNSMFINFFFQGRNQELARMFKKAPPEEKTQALDMLSRLDVANANQYKTELK